MKKLLTLVLALCLMMSGACASASTFDDLMDQLNGRSGNDQTEGLVSYDMPELQLTLKLPETYTVLYENTPEETFAALGMDKASIMESLKTNSTYMLIFTADFMHEIDVVMSKSEVNSFADLTDELLQESAGLMEGMFADMGCTVDHSDLCTVNGIKYIRTWYSVAGSESATYVMQYYTVENSMGIVYRMFAYTGEEISQDKQDELLQLAQNVRYN